MTDTIPTTPPRAARPDTTDAHVEAQRRELAELARLLDVFDGQEHGRERRALLAYGVGAD
jgi:hypothetical protein